MMEPIEDRPRAAWVERCDAWVAHYGGRIAATVCENRGGRRYGVIVVADEEEQALAAAHERVDRALRRDGHEPAPERPTPLVADHNPAAATDDAAYAEAARRVLDPEAFARGDETDAEFRARLKRAHGLG